MVTAHQLVAFGVAAFVIIAIPGDGAGLPPRRALRQGFVVGFSNSKAFMTFAALLPQFVDRGAGHLPAQLLLLGLLAFLIGLLSDSVWALAASQLRSWSTGSPRRGRALGAAGGMSMIGLGVALLVTGRPDWLPRQSDTATTLAAAPRTSVWSPTPGTCSGSRSGAVTWTTTVCPRASTVKERPG